MPTLLERRIDSVSAITAACIVKVTDPQRALSLGGYVEAVQMLVPSNEAPFRSDKWQVVVSAFLYHSDEGEAGLRIRFFGPDGKLRATDHLSMMLDMFELGDILVAAQSNEEHSYNSRGDLWLLADDGRPKTHISANVTFGKFSAGPTNPGVWLNRQT
jgi:hypothetical protein